ncbi:MAG: TRAP transporter permease [Pseudomonadota bacterium]
MEDVGLAAHARPRPRALSLLTDALGAILTVVAIVWALDVPRELDLALFTEQFLALLLALAFALTFLTVPAIKDRPGPPPWYDVLAAISGFAACGYIALRYPALVHELVYKPWDGILIGAVIIVLILEGARRTTGWTLVVVVGAFIAYALVGDWVPGRLQGRPVGLDRLSVYLALDTNAVLGTPLLVAATVVIAFILMGQVLARCGGAEYFNDISLAMMGRSRGGSAKITTISSLLFGTISGSAVANVVSSGVMTIPLMRRAGYPPEAAAAIEAVSSTGGQLVPPVMGAAAFLMAEFLQIPYSEVAIAAIVPAALYYLALYAWVDLQAGRAGYLPVPAEEIPPAREILLAGWHFPIPFVVLIVALFWLNYSPELSAMLATAILVVTGMTIGYRGRRMGLRDLVWAVTSTGAAVIDVLMICAAAGLVIGILNLTGLAFGLTLTLVLLGGQNVFYLLFMTAAISIVLGMGMPTVGVYVLLATLVGPALVQAGFDPIAAHMFLLYFGMLSMVTPPVALAAYAAASIAQADFWRTGLESMRCGWTAYLVPFIFVFESGLILKGDPWLAAWEVAGACAGVIAVTAALAGYLRRPLDAIARAGFGIAGAALLLPMQGLTGSPALDILGIALAFVMLVREARLARLVA